MVPQESTIDREYHCCIPSAQTASCLSQQRMPQGASSASAGTSETFCALPYRPSQTMTCSASIQLHLGGFLGKWQASQAAGFMTVWLLPCCAIATHLMWCRLLLQRGVARPGCSRLCLLGICPGIPFRGDAGQPRNPGACSSHHSLLRPGGEAA